MKKNHKHRKSPAKGIECEEKWMVDLFARKKSLEQHELDFEAYKKLWLAALQQRMVDLMVFLPRKKGSQSQQTALYIDWDFINQYGGQAPLKNQRIDSEQYYYAWQAVRWFESWQYRMTKSILEIDNDRLDARLKSIIKVVKIDLEHKRQIFLEKNIKSKQTECSSL